VSSPKSFLVAAQWLNAAHECALAVWRGNVHFKETAEGIWTAELPAGDYKAQVRVTGQRLTELLLQGEASFTVPDDPLSGTLDLGGILRQKAQ